MLGQRRRTRGVGPPTEGEVCASYEAAWYVGEGDRQEVPDSGADGISLGKRRVAGWHCHFAVADWRGFCYHGSMANATLERAAEFFGASALDGVLPDIAPFMAQVYVLGLRSGDAGMGIDKGWEPFAAVVVPWQAGAMRRWYAEGWLAGRRALWAQEEALLAQGRVQP